MGFGQEVVDAVMADWQAAPVSKEVRAALGFLTKFVPPEEDFGPEDIAKMREVGLSKDAIKDLMYVSWCFQNLSRWMDAFGFPTHTSRLLKVAGRGLWSMGYDKIKIRD